MVIIQPIQCCIPWVLLHPKHAMGQGGDAEETHVVLVANNKVPAQRKRERKTNLDLKRRISILSLVGGD